MAVDSQPSWRKSPTTVAVVNPTIMTAKSPTIMAVVAVLEIHMERNMVGSMNPSISSRGLVPEKIKAQKIELNL
jgi:hypothetical protein